MGEPLPAEVVAGDWWNEGRSVTGSLRLANGARCDTSWIQLLDTYEYSETISFFFADSVRTLTFPSPWLRQYPTVYRRSDATARRTRCTRHVVRGVLLARARAFPRVHRDGTTCRTPPEQARARHRRADEDVPRQEPN